MLGELFEQYSEDEIEEGLIQPADEPVLVYSTADGGQTWAALAVPTAPDTLVGEASGGMSLRVFRLHGLLVELIRAASTCGLSDFTRVSSDGRASWSTLQSLPTSSTSRLVLPQFEDSRHWFLASGAAALAHL